MASETSHRRLCDEDSGLKQTLQYDYSGRATLALSLVCRAVIVRFLAALRGQNSVAAGSGCCLHPTTTGCFMTDEILFDTSGQRSSTHFPSLVSSMPPVLSSHSRHFFLSPDGEVGPVG